jgi:hypothetical protein
MLKSISDTSNGIYYFLQSQGDNLLLKFFAFYLCFRIDFVELIPESVGDCLGGLLSIVATNVTMVIEGILHHLLLCERERPASIDLNIYFLICLLILRHRRPMHHFRGDYEIPNDSFGRK